MSAAHRIVIVTGTRAEFGLLLPIMHAIRASENMELRVIATGTHLLPPALTIEEVRGEFGNVRTVLMQRPDEAGSIADAHAVGRGIAGIADALKELQPAIVLVLGDRIEAFAASIAASIGGFALGHIHGGDRAEGIADEAMRHAITKLAHVHFPATPQSADRIIRMGEDPADVHIVGSPAIDDLEAMAALDDAAFAELGEPVIVFLMHPVGRDDELEEQDAACALRACAAVGRTIALHPNHDPGRDGIIRAIDRSGVRHVAHLPRASFIGLLRRVRVIVGNSSAGLIECAALGLPCVNLGSRQSGRERAGNTRDMERIDQAELASIIGESVRSGGTLPREHPFGRGDTGPQVVSHLERILHEPVSLRKRNSY